MLDRYLEATMIASSAAAHSQLQPSDLPSELPEIKLRHGESLWVLSQLGYQGAVSKSTFYEYIKSLRKLGAPFGRKELRLAQRGAHKDYSYFHLMELALMLTLRVYNVVPDSILAEIVRCRRSLYRMYRRAYQQRCSELGAPVTVKLPGHDPIHLRGVFLDLQINFSGGTLTSFGPPKLISPCEALALFAERNVAARSLLPINLSLLCERLVWTALHAPVIRRGQRPHSERCRHRLDTTAFL
jgi:hypothetical protein